MSVYQELATKLLIPKSKLIAELFSMLVNEDEAKMLLALPSTAPKLAVKFDMTEEQVEAKLHEFFLKGLVFKSKKPQGTKYYSCKDVAQFHDATILWIDAPRSFLDLWQRFMEEEWPAYTKLVEPFMPRPLTRIIPVEQSIAPRSQVLAFESVREVIDAAEQIAVTKCTCRTTAHKCDRPVEVCLQIGKAAAYALERGTGRAVTHEEALEIVEQSEEAGLIHVTMNRSDNMHFICNCCGCCCIALPVMIEHGRKLCDPSRFLAEVEEDLCTGCGDCLERCFFNALDLPNDADAPIVDAEKCMGCGLCQVVCPTEAIVLTEVREKKFIPAA